MQSDNAEKKKLWQLLKENFAKKIKNKSILSHYNKKIDNTKSAKNIRLLDNSTVPLPISDLAHIKFWSITDATLLLTVEEV